MNENKKPGNNDLYVVRWKNNKNGKENKPTHNHDYTTTMILLDINKRQFPEIEHWVEEYHGE